MTPTQPFGFTKLSNIFVDPFGKYRTVIDSFDHRFFQIATVNQSLCILVQHVFDADQSGCEITEFLMKSFSFKDAAFYEEINEGARKLHKKVQF